MNTMQADLSAPLERFEADRERRNAEFQKRLATATKRIWWQTAVLLGGMGIVGAVIIAAVA